MKNTQKKNKGQYPGLVKLNKYPVIKTNINFFLDVRYIRDISNANSNTVSCDVYINQIRYGLSGKANKANALKLLLLIPLQIL